MLNIDNLFLRIGDSQILNGVNLKLSAGEKVGIIGPNGSGKTTLFNCLSGFHLPTSGNISFKEQNISHLAPSKRATLGLGRLFQNFGIFREMTVLENIIVALESKQPAVFFPWSKRNKNNKERAFEFLQSIGLESKLKDKAGSLSGGQLRLLEIIRLIAFGADLFLLDEPTAGVSPKMKGEIEHAIKKLQKIDTSLLIIEHDINFIQRLCDRVVVLDVGQVVLDDTPDNVRNDTRLQEIYFGSSNGHNGATKSTLTKIESK
jgi:branched-chain amino acid transport system ATP-binding protein